MQITITTRHLMHMLMAAYRTGNSEAGTPEYDNNAVGRPEMVCQNLLMKEMLNSNDFINQQT